MRRSKPFTDEEREARNAAQAELVKESVERLRTSEGWQAWLQSRSRFHRYSLGNQILIALQAPDAVRVAGFRKWLEFGYCVRRGERAIKIWAPMPPSKKMIEQAKVEGTTARTFFRLVSVFGDDQVDELPPPAKPIPLRPPHTKIEGDSLSAVWEPLVAFGESLGCSVSVEHTGSAGGFLRPDDMYIAISEDSSPNGQVSTLIHELSHALVRVDRQEDDPVLNYDQEELVVESVTMSVTGVLGFDISGYAIPYLTAWSTNEDIGVIERTAKLINRLASRIEEVLPEVNEDRPLTAAREEA